MCQKVGKNTLLLTTELFKLELGQLAFAKIFFKNFPERESLHIGFGKTIIPNADNI